MSCRPKNNVAAVIGLLSYAQQAYDSIHFDDDNWVSSPAEATREEKLSVDRQAS